MNATLRAGCAKVDLTPEHPVRLIPAGPGPRLSQGVARRLHARIIVMQAANGSPEHHGSGYLVFVSADMLYFPNDSAHRLREAIRSKWESQRKRCC